MTTEHRPVAPHHPPRARVPAAGRPGPRIPPPAPPPPPLLPPVVPAPPPRSPLRVACAVLLLMLGLGLLGGAAAGTWLRAPDPGTGTAAATAAQRAFDERRALWRELRVDQLLPPEVTGEGAGPGGADRRWSRAAVAPDGGCEGAFDAPLAGALEPYGCHRLLRATYVDATETTVTTVGLLFTEAGPDGSRELSRLLDSRGLAARPDALPRTYPGSDPASGGFGDAQRVSWSLRALTDLPVVVYTVTGFADGRAAPEQPRPAAEALRDGAGSVAALSGIAHDAQGLAERLERGLRKAADRREGAL